MEDTSLAVEIELEDSAVLGAVLDPYTYHGYEFAALIIRPVGAVKRGSKLVTFDEQAASWTG